MINVFDIKDFLHTLIEEAEQYNLDDAPCHYSHIEAEAWLAGRVASLHKLDQMFSFSVEICLPTEGSPAALD